jgi:cytochrome d ubiquinol oxidase subunit I
MLNAAYLTTGFVVLSVGARYLLSNRHQDDARLMMRMAIGLLIVLAPLQLVIGDLHGLNTLAHQPIKVAAMEAHWDGSKPGDFHIFAWPDQKNETNRFAISIPRGASLILKHDPDGLFPGLKDVPASERPPVPNVFFGFRIMLAVGVFMIAAAFAGGLLWWRDRLFETRWYMRIVSRTWWTGFVAVIAGWVVTESGRQPWLAHGIIRTADAVSPVAAESVAFTLALFVVVYTVVFSMGIYFINRLIEAGPQPPPVTDEEGLPNRPISAAGGAVRRAIGET